MNFLEWNGRRLELPDLADITNNEMRVFKRASGLRLGEIQEAVETGDNDIVIGLLAVALQREDGRVDIDALLNDKIGAITVVVEEDEKVPPTDEAEPVNGSGSGSPTLTPMVG